MALVSLQEVRVAFGGPPVLDGANFAIERGERVCVLGRNGAGKSTFMQVLDGTLLPDSGLVVRQGGVTIARLEQDVPRTLTGTMFDIVSAGLGEAGALLARYHAASVRVTTDYSEKALQELDRLHRQVDAANAWQLHLRVETALQHLGLDPEARIEQASGGRTRQALLARALVNAPDVLLLDEPTNHLDIDAIEWMEQFLIDEGITLLFVTHDRAFLRRVATRIVELDRGRLADYGGRSRPCAWSARSAVSAWAPPAPRFRKPSARAASCWKRRGSPLRTAHAPSCATSPPPSCVVIGWGSWAPTARGRPRSSSCCSRSWSRRQGASGTGRISTSPTSISCASSSIRTRV
jgi:ATP-binding cassette subfamily F protein uup